MKTDMIKLLIKKGRVKSFDIINKEKLDSIEDQKHLLQLLNSICIIGGFGSVKLTRQFIKDKHNEDKVFGVFVHKIKLAICDVKEIKKVNKHFDCREWWNT